MKRRTIANTLFSTVVATLATLLVYGCGKSNSVKSYQNLARQSIPSNQVVQQNDLQELVSADFFSIEADGAFLNKDLVFYEGQTTKHTLVLRLTNGGTGYKLLLNNPPAGASLSPSPTDASSYILAWTLPAEFLGLNEASREQSLSVTIQAPSGAPQDFVDALSKLQPPTIPVVIYHSQGLPTIDSVTGLDTPIASGDQRQVLVNVTDPSSLSTPPVLVVTQGKLAVSRDHEVDGADYLVFNNTSVEGPETPTSLGAGKWQFHLLLDTKSRTVSTASEHKDPTTGEEVVSMQVSLQVISGRSENRSAETPNHISVEVGSTATPSTTSSTRTGTTRRKTSTTKR